MRQTKQELLTEAKSLGVRGRHDMSRDELEAAVTRASINLSDDHELMLETADMDGEHDDESADDESAAEALQAAAERAASLDPEVTKDKKRRYPSEAKRDPVTRRVVRKGVRFNLNVPFREKLYYLPSHYEGLDQFQVTLAAAPPQVRAIAATMLASFGDRDSAARGKDVVAEAKRSGRLTSKIADDMLFAYYRRVLETVGVVHWDGDDE